MRELYLYKYSYLIALLTRTFHSANTLEPLETLSIHQNCLYIRNSDINLDISSVSGNSMYLAAGNKQDFLKTNFSTCF